MKRCFARVVRRAPSVDPWLAAALLLALLFCLYGIHWGTVECWNRDQMALRGLKGLKPSGYLKPPFHIYLNHLFVLSPLHVVEYFSALATGAPENFNHARLLLSRTLVVALFLGSIVLGYAFSLRVYGKAAARIMALFFATSAGFITYAHFLSVDSPLLFWMLLALVLAHRITSSPNLSNYIWAGLVTGLAAATKYNGLAVGITIPVAHLLSCNWTTWKNLLFDKRLLVGVLMVPAGFILGNPYSILDAKHFIGDFMYNYRITPHYGGETGTGYTKFLARVPEIIGWPGGLAIAVFLIASLYLMALRGKERRPAVHGFVLCASVALLYYIKIGGFARMPTRLVLPAVPFLILMAGPCLQAAATHGRWIYFGLAPIFAYNAICSAFVGKRFSDDPRLAAQSWMTANVAAGSTVESSAGSPHWSKLRPLDWVETRAENPMWSKMKPGQRVDLRMPVVNGRAELFGRIFAGDRWVEERRHREGHPDETLFTLEALMKRDPGYIAIYSSDSDAPSEVVKTYYQTLLEGVSPYGIAFDGVSPSIPLLIYPLNIDFLKGRVTILKRSSQANTASPPRRLTKASDNAL